MNQKILVIIDLGVDRDNIQQWLIFKNASKETRAVTLSDFSPLRPTLQNTPRNLHFCLEITSFSPLAPLAGWCPFPLSLISGFICKVVRRHRRFLIEVLRVVSPSAPAAGWARPWGSGVLSYKRRMQTDNGTMQMDNADNADVCQGRSASPACEPAARRSTTRGSWAGTYLPSWCLSLPPGFDNPSRTEPFLSFFLFIA